MIRLRGLFSTSSIVRFGIGYNNKAFFHDRSDDRDVRLKSFEGKDSYFLHLLQNREYKQIQETYDNLIRQGAIPTVRARFLLYESFIKDKNIDGAIKYFNIEKRRPPPKKSAVFYDPIISCLGMEGYIEESEVLLHEMTTVARLPMTDSTNALMVRVYVKNGNIPKAKEYLNNMRYNGNRSIRDYRTVLIAFGNIGDTETVNSILSSLRNDGREIDDVMIGALFNSYLVNAEYDKAYGVLNELDNHQIKLSDQTTEMLIKYLRKSHMLDKIPEILQAMDSRGVPRTWRVYHTLLFAYVEANQSDKVLETFNDMRARNIARNITTYTMMIAHFKSPESAETAFDLLGHMRADGLRPPARVIQTVHSQLLERGNTTEATKLQREYPLVSFSRD